MATIYQDNIFEIIKKMSKFLFEQKYSLPKGADFHSVADINLCEYLKLNNIFVYEMSEKNFCAINLNKNSFKKHGSEDLSFVLDRFTWYSLFVNEISSHIKVINKNLGNSSKKDIAFLVNKFSNLKNNYNGKIKIEVDVNHEGFHPVCKYSVIYDGLVAQEFLWYEKPDVFGFTCHLYRSNFQEFLFRNKIKKADFDEGLQCYIQYLFLNLKAYWRIKDEIFDRKKK